MTDNKIYGTGRIHIDKHDALKIRSEQKFSKKTVFENTDKVQLIYYLEKKELLIKRFKDLD